MAGSLYNPPKGLSSPSIPTAARAAVGWELSSRTSRPRYLPPESKAPSRRGEALVDDQQVPDLEEMDGQQAQYFLMQMFTHLSAEAEYKLRHEDFVMEMPQSGERIRGRKKMREFQEAYPTPPTIHLRRVIVREGLWVIEGVNDYGEGQVFTVVVIFELRDGKIWRDTRYYAEPFEVPRWRANLVERM